MQQKQIKQFQQEILSWYVKNKRDLPWRGMPDDIPLDVRAYRVLVSEIMLQQTQVSRVIPKYEAWLEAFPTVEALSQAKKEDILRLWSGLGYNRRALYLQKTAQAIVEKGNWPQTIEELEKLPGIGPYTSRAIACFALNMQVAVVDANVRKVILLKFARHCEGQSNEVISKKRRLPRSLHSLAMTNNELQIIADQLLPIGRAYDWNQALMDYSNLVLQKEKVPTKKQSTFKDSDRYYRGKLLRLLLEKQTLSLDKIGYLLRDDFSDKDTSWLTTLVDKLSRDGLVTVDEGKVGI